MHQNEFQGAQAQHFMDQHSSRAGFFLQPPPFPPPAPTTEMSPEFAMYSPFVMSPSSIMFGAGAEDTERARLLPPQPPPPHPLLLSPPNPTPVNMSMERHTGTNQYYASPVSPTDSPNNASSSPSSSPTSSQYTDYMYGYGGNGYWWWDHYLHERHNYDFVQDDGDCDYDYGDGDDDMEPLYSFVWQDDKDDFLQCDNVPDVDPDDDEDDDDLGENVLDYCGTGTSGGADQLVYFDMGDPSSQDITSIGNSNRNSIIDNDIEATPPPMEDNLVILDDEEDIGNGWTYVTLDRIHKRANDTDDLFSFIGTPPSSSSSDASHSPNREGVLYSPSRLIFGRP
jgi:hypothetical protein